MASSKRPHLLTLPREIRNIIYEHLTHEVTHQFWYNGTRDRRPTHERTEYITRGADVTFHHAPIVSLLCTNHQLHAEYIETPIFQNASATAEYDMSHHPANDGPTLSQPGKTMQAFSFCSIRCLTIRSCTYYRPYGWISSGITEFVNKMESYMPRLSKVTIICCSQLNGPRSKLRISELNEINATGLWTDIDKEDKAMGAVISPFQDLLGLSLQQAVRGVLFHLGDFMCKRKLEFSKPCFLARVVEAWVFDREHKRIPMTSADVFEALTSNSKFLTIDPLTDQRLSKSQWLVAKPLVSKMYAWQELPITN